LLRLDIGVSDQFTPGLELDLDARRELVRRAFDRVEIKRLQALLHVRMRDELDNRAMERGDDLLRCRDRHQDAEPLVPLKDRLAAFCGGWDVGQLARARFARERERAQMALHEQRYGRRQ